MVLNMEKLEKIVNSVVKNCDGRHGCDGCPYATVKPYCRVAMYVDAGIELAYVDDVNSHLVKLNNDIKESYDGPRGSFHY